ncbi:MAG: 30S ribosomal protein S17 [Candidatus Amesbacteria bacterium GW2011_GWB1_47_26]|uniref:Small ribosomal subunit protein uS17 n=1 Tax=Candidatus Amesbacteria bacterium GW2011_GWC2_45_19 TaxID=1618366 RepID=A0A0G1M4G2_9BACT|nr:MAG: 30S ribosomal protein S17 [Candidatus Amesbacteria bacterium GW2011_GWC2_45_19]KKU38757.1 MAG: 30S ribosomal protein S17 [Candidatus Amesbacteria bacterium GW2011_GWA1_46_35]KKU69259.1 MAG: 30S ribosomal protein S17 [Microgenomates group bacterium GW2011_GWC1_47_20]KKU75110.1 MAG: 30S ribosomal protein S17 [Candidatus Amesbacteria bacterium GW2011_GWB1_47_26]KKU80407.1 MAG: 30S ribosomal protein S17 [Candidatus Amesbacteria bacterium GW2011_GWA2_47_70]
MRTLSGKVISNKMAKTVVVEVERLVVHPKYHKRIKRTQKFHAHSELGIKIGDVVKIAEVKPISRTKTWRII